MIKLGTKVKDKVTGFVGIATSRIEFLNGCVQYSVKPKMKKGENKVPESSFFDEQQLEILEKKKLDIKKKSTGGGFRQRPKL